MRSFNREPTPQNVVFSEALHKSNVRIQKKKLQLLQLSKNKE